MDIAEARALLADELSSWRARSYPELVERMKDETVIEVEGRSGATYQIEIEVFWDDRPGGTLHVVGGIDDGGVRAFAPLTDDFVMTPDGTFVGE